MLTIILTRPGERIMEPTFGCPLHRIDATHPFELIAEEAKQMIATALRDWEKRVQVIDIDIIIVPVEVYKIDINATILFVDPNDINKVNRLVIQVPIGQ